MLAPSVEKLSTSKFLVGSLSTYPSVLWINDAIVDNALKVLKALTFAGTFHAETIIDLE